MQNRVTIFSNSIRCSIALLLLLLLPFVVAAQTNNDTFDDGFTVKDNTFNPNRALDSLNTSHKEVPKGMKVWTLSEHFGDRLEATADTSMHLFMNKVFTTGLYGEYNTTGNLGSPRISRIVTDRDFSPTFAFTEPYGYFITKPTEIRFTNTLSPITNATYFSCGDKTDGEDKLKVLFATNINKEAGVGFKFDYDYGRGFYQNQNISLFDYTMWGSYVGEKYWAHLIFSFDHMKTTENGGITNDEYIVHPEAFSEQYSTNEIPVHLNSNWNRNDGFHATLSHRYNIGFYRKVPMTEMEKEAKRFALKAQKEREEKERQKREQKGGGSVRAGKQGSKDDRGFAGRPSDAKIAGDLSNDSVRAAIKRQKEELKNVGVDSLLADKKEEKKDTSWLKDEYVPVTGFIHNLQFDRNTREYRAYASPQNYYLNRYTVPTAGNVNDSISDNTKYFSLRNTFAVGLLEGFNKYVPMGLKVFLAHQLRHYELPELEYQTVKYNENNLSLGGQLIKQQGSLFHYLATAEFFVLGEDLGSIKIDGTGDMKLRLGKRDSLNVNLKAFYHLTNPTFLQRHYHSKHFWWDNTDMSKQMQTHLEGAVSLSRTRTTLRVAYDNFNKLVYLATSYDVNNHLISKYTANIRQSGENISLFTVMLEQNFKVGILNWENRITFQSSSNQDILPAPKLNIWTNLYLAFKIARVLDVNFGADMYWFTKYYAPEYCAQLGQYAVQENEAVRTKVGGYPYVDVYANFRLKQCRFFVMMSHVNSGAGNRNYFLAPHYPQNERLLRLGLCWTFFN